MEDYTFAEYLFDNGLIKDVIEVDTKELQAYWAVEEERYINFCKENNLYYEDLNII